MSGIALEETVIDRLRRRFPAYHETAYLFILSGLQYTIERLDQPRHIAAAELAAGCRDLALDRWGLMSREVLRFWGINSTRDLGEIVFALVDCGVLVKQDDDCLSAFDELFDFDAVFGREYSWPNPLDWSGTTG